MGKSEARSRKLSRKWAGSRKQRLIHSAPTALIKMIHNTKLQGRGEWMCLHHRKINCHLSRTKILQSQKKLNKRKYWDPCNVQKRTRKLFSMTNNEYNVSFLVITKNFCIFFVIKNLIFVHIFWILEKILFFVAYWET